METIKDYQDKLDGTELGTQLDDQLKKARRHRGGRDFSGVEVVSKEVMGHDGGDFNARTEHVRISQAMIATREGVKKVAEVMIHEDFHRGNANVGGAADNVEHFAVEGGPRPEGRQNHSEGFVQWLTLDTLQAANNSAYQEEVSEIEKIANKIGREKVRAIGRGKNPELNLWMSYVHKLIENGMEMDEAAEEGNQRMAAAA